MSDPDVTMIVSRDYITRQELIDALQDTMTHVSRVAYIMSTDDAPLLVPDVIRLFHESFANLVGNLIAHAPPHPAAAPQPESDATVPIDPNAPRR